MKSFRQWLAVKLIHAAEWLLYPSRECLRILRFAPSKRIGRSDRKAWIESEISSVLCYRIKHIGERDQLYTGCPSDLIRELTAAVMAEKLAL